MQFNMQLNGIILFPYLLNPVDSLINLHQNTSENWLCGSDGWLGNVIELSVFFYGSSIDLCCLWTYLCIVWCVWIFVLCG